MCSLFTDSVLKFIFIFKFYFSPHFPSELNIRCPEMEIML